MTMLLSSIMHALGRLSKRPTSKLAEMLLLSDKVASILYVETTRLLLHYARN